MLSLWFLKCYFRNDFLVSCHIVAVVAKPHQHFTFCFLIFSYFTFIINIFLLLLFFGSLHQNHLNHNNNKYRHFVQFPTIYHLTPSSKVLFSIDNKKTKAETTSATRHEEILLYETSTIHT